MDNLKVMDKFLETYDLPRHNQEETGRGFPGGTVVENLPASAGDTGSSPGLGGSHVPRSSWARITEPAHLEPVLHNKRGRDSETPAHRDEEWPPLATT